MALLGSALNASLVEAAFDAGVDTVATGILAIAFGLPATTFLDNHAPSVYTMGARYWVLDLGGLLYLAG